MGGEGNTVGEACGGAVRVPAQYPTENEATATKAAYAATKVMGNKDGASSAVELKHTTFLAHSAFELSAKRLERVFSPEVSALVWI